MAMSIIAIAEACHEMNRVWCEANGDFSQPRWSDAPDWQKDSAINGVIFRTRNPDATSEDMHDNWLRQKEKEGWVWGPMKDVDRKEHPCMLPYNHLPPDQRAKDMIFSGTVDLLFKAGQIE